MSAALVLDEARSALGEDGAAAIADDDGARCKTVADFVAVVERELGR